jgi:hypothetical protein
MTVIRSGPYHRSARRVLAWCEWYTRDLDPRVAAERRDEIAADLHDEALHAESSGATPASAARSIMGRWIRGVPADLAWRVERLRNGEAASPVPMSIRRIGASLAAVLFMLGLTLAGTGVFTLVRVVRALVIGDTTAVPPGTRWLLVLTFFAILGTILVCSRATRSIGALLLVPSVLILQRSADVLWFVSATAQVIVARMWQLDLLISVMSIGLAIVFLAAALWWSPSILTWRRRRTPPAVSASTGPAPILPASTGPVTEVR